VKSFALLLLFSIPLFASGVLQNVEIFKRTERVDVLFTFAQSFDESIIQHSGEGYQTVILKNTPFTGDVKEEIHALGIDQIRIFGKENDLCLMILSSQNMDITASKTTDGFGLRVRLKELSAKDNAQQAQQATVQRPKIELYEQILSRSEYLSVVTLLFLFLFLLLFIRKRVLKPKGAKTGLVSWLFKPKNSNDIEIIQQKALDMKNRFITIESHGYRYLILIGAMGNTLIDRYPITRPIRDDSLVHVREEESFNKLLAQKKGQLLDYLEGEKKGNHLYPNS